jgi:hypothetical protein
MTTLVTNNATTTLASALTSAQVSISLSPGTGALFPNPTGGAYCWCTLSNAGGAVEVVQVTARATDTLTVVRGQDNTTARAWNAGDKFELRPCAALFNDKMDVLSATGRLLNVQVLTSSGTYTPTAGTNSVVVEVQGAGGAGGGAVATGAATWSCSLGGSVGGYIKHRMTSGFSGAAYTIGSPGTGVSGAAGNAGGNTTFGALTAPGGLGGISSAALSVASNTNSITPSTAVSGGNILNIPGAPATPANVWQASNLFVPSIAGNGLLGVGGVYGFNAAGSAARGYGAGGGACNNTTSQPAFAGGAGAPGVIFVWEYA